MQNHNLLMNYGVACHRLTGQGSRPNAPGRILIAMAIELKQQKTNTQDVSRLWAKGPASTAHKTQKTHTLLNCQNRSCAIPAKPNRSLGKYFCPT